MQQKDKRVDSASFQNGEPSGQVMRPELEEKKRNEPFILLCVRPTFPQVVCHYVYTACRHIDFSLLVCRLAMSLTNVSMEKLSIRQAGGPVKVLLLRWDRSKQTARFISLQLHPLQVHPLQGTRLGNFVTIVDY
jgi:hypothetical protein